MRPIGRAVRFGAAAVALLVGATGVLAGQGVTSAAVQGRVISETRGNVQSAIVVLTNTRTGAKQQTTTNAAGRYNLENTTPGGPYTIDVRAIGFQPASKSGIILTLGQKYTQDFELKQQAVTLEELTVIAATNPLINSGRTGASQIVTDTAIQRLPLLGRNFTDLLRTSPHVLSGSSIGGQNAKYNTILIDGGANNDVFGVGTGTPGIAAGAKPLSLEALQEFQILVAPFDIRQGSFSGGLVNGITKSGTNEFHGSLFGYTQRTELVGVDTTRPVPQRISRFEIKQYGGTLGGPIIKNKLHFFGSADIQSSGTQFIGLSASDPATGISVATATRVQDIITSKYGFDPGGIDAPDNLLRPDKNLFGKLTWQAGGSSQLEVSYNYVKASTDVFNRTFRQDATRDGWQLSASGHTIANHTNTARAKFTSLLGNANLEVLLGYLRVRDARAPNLARPLILVQDQPGFYLAAGGERFSHGNELDQDVYEATANITFGIARNHQVTIGTHNEFFKFRNLFANNRFGTWTFGSADSLDAGLARRFEVQVERRPDGFTAAFKVKQVGGYIQDAWTPNDRLTLTAGLRADVPYFGSTPFQNPDTALVNPNTLAINTGQFPTGNVMLSPRLGFNWDPMGNGNTIVRGGVGIFSGRPPYVWMSNAFSGTGLEQATLLCDPFATTNPGNPPPFTADLDAIPTACGSGGRTSFTPLVSYFDKDFKFQQALKYAVGIDHRLPGGFVATVDFIHTASKNQMYQVDDNVRLGAINAEGRQLYATPNATGTGLVRLTKTSNIAQVVHHTNRSADQSTMLTLQLQKSFESGLSFSAAYTRSKTRDLMSMTSSQAASNLRFTALDGTLENRNLRTSGFDVPHKIGLSGSANLPFGLQASMVFTARSGLPYAWTYNADANGDGNVGNDLLYVPKDANDITLSNPADWDRLNAFIASEKCLREQRGRIMERNSCRNPWQKFVDLRLGKVIPTMSGQRLEVTADIFNFLNLVDRDWGYNRETAPNEEVNILTLGTGALGSYDNRGTPGNQADDRGRYVVPSATAMPSLNKALPNSSRWRIQLGGKYTF